MDLKTLMAKIEAAQRAQREEIAKNGRESDDLKAAIATMDGELKALKAAVSRDVARGNRAGVGGGASTVSKSAGVQFAESKVAEQLKAAKGKLTNTAPVQIEGSLLAKAAVPITTGIGGAALSVDRRPGFMAAPEPTLTMRDLLNVQRTNSTSIEYIVEEGFYHFAAKTTAAATIGATSITLDEIGGMFVGQELQLSPGAANADKATVEAINTTTKVVTIAPATLSAHPAGSVVTSDRFVFTPETNVKPRATVDYRKETCNVQTLAHWVPTTRQVLDDVEWLQNRIDNQLVEGLRRVEEWQILYGAGGNEQLEGIFTNSKVPSYAWSNGAATDNKMDALRRAITLAHLAEYAPTAVVVSPQDWEDIELEKGTDGHYLQGTVVAEGRQPRIWRVPVVVSNSLKAGDALVGAFNLAATLYDRQDAEVRISDSHTDYFTRNMIAILAEYRVAFCIERPEAFVKVDLSTPPAPPEDDPVIPGD